MKKYLALICAILVLFGCSTNNTYHEIKSHNTENIQNKIYDVYEDENNEEFLLLTKDIISSYVKILQELSEEEIKSDELDSYIQDLETMKNNYSFLISQNDEFTQALTDLIKDFSELSDSRNYMEKAISALDDNDLSNFFDLSKNITLFDKYSMKKIVDLTNNKIDSFEDTIQITDYSFKNNSIEYTIKNNRNDNLETVLLIYFVYDKNGNPIELSSNVLFDSRIKNAGYQIKRYIDIDPNSIQNIFIPCTLEIDEVNIKFIPVACEFSELGEIYNQLTLCAII